MDITYGILGMLFGGMIVAILYSVFEHDYGWKKRYKISRMKPKVGDMFATYHHFFVEDWMMEDYNELFVVKNVGKRYVRLESIDDRRGSAGGVSSGRIVDVEILQLDGKYLKYSGTRNKNSIYDDVLGD